MTNTLGSESLFLAVALGFVPLSQSPPLRICFFIDQLDEGGIAVVTINLTNALARRGHQIDLLALDTSGSLMSRISESVRVVDLKCRRTRYALPPLLKHISAAKPDIVVGAMPHINTLLILTSLLMAFRGPRVIATEHNALSPRAVNGWGRLLNTLVRAIYRLPYKVVCCSEGIRQELIEEFGLPQEQVVTIHNAVVSPLALAALDVQPEDPWLSASEDPLIVTSGRLHPQKDHRSLLLAFSKVAEQRPARLLIFGEGEERRHLEALIQDLGLYGRVRLAGHVPDALARMKAADLFVLSSRHEGLPTVLIEALLCGLPVVSTDCRHGPREILAGGRYGTLVPVGDVDALAAAMMQSLQVERNPEIQRARAMTFTVEQAALRYEALLLDRPNLI